MWQSKKAIRALYDDELCQQTDAYSYYIENIEKNIDYISTVNEGEHESVPLICLNGEELSVNLISEDDKYRIYEAGDYYIYESCQGMSSDKERQELVTNAYKLNTDLIYSDVDSITCDGKRFAPFYKPCFGTDTYMCYDYFSDFYAVRKNKSKVQFNLLEKISHVPKVLFHYNFKDNIDNPNEIYQIKNSSYLTDEFYLNNIDLSEEKEKVSVIIPSKDNPHLIKTCLEGLKKAKIKSGINVLEVAIIDNGSTNQHKEEITGVIKEATTHNAGFSIEYIYEPMEFNFSLMCNIGAKKATGQYLLFMNDDIEVTDELFILKLLYFAKMDHVGAVGCKLLYPGEEKRIQHVGITCLKYPGPSHKLSTFEDNRSLYFGRNRGVHNCLSVTGACLMVSSEKYFKIGGFHDKMKVGYNDVDLCISLFEQGYKNVVNNECVLVHHESITRGSDAADKKKLKRLDMERNLLYERHPWLLTKGDPYYNPNLAEDFLDYRVNVIPKFERRDFVSDRIEKLEAYVNKIESASGELATAKNMFLNIENVVLVRDHVEISGWSLINKKENYLYDTYLAVSDEKGHFGVYETARKYREDLEAVFKDAKSVKLSGFFARVKVDENTTEAPKRYGVLMINKQTGKKYYAGFTKSDI